MANHTSAIKRHKQSIKRNARNRAARTRVKNVVKEVRAAIQAQNKEDAQPGQDRGQGRHPLEEGRPQGVASGQSRQRPRRLKADRVAGPRDGTHKVPVSRRVPYLIWREDGGKRRSLIFSVWEKGYPFSLSVLKAHW